MTTIFCNLPNEIWLSIIDKLWPEDIHNLCIASYILKDRLKSLVGLFSDVDLSIDSEFNHIETKFIIPLDHKIPSEIISKAKKLPYLIVELHYKDNRTELSKALRSFSNVHISIRDVPHVFHSSRINDMIDITMPNTSQSWDDIYDEQYNEEWDRFYVKSITFKDVTSIILDSDPVARLPLLRFPHAISIQSKDDFRDHGAMKLELSSLKTIRVSGTMWSIKRIVNFDTVPATQVIVEHIQDVTAWHNLTWPKVEVITWDSSLSQLHNATLLTVHMTNARFERLKELRLHDIGIIQGLYSPLLETLCADNFDSNHDIDIERLYTPNLKHIELSGTCLKRFMPQKELNKVESAVLRFSHVEFGESKVNLSFLSNVEELDIGHCTNFLKLATKIKTLRCLDPLGSRPSAPEGYYNLPHLTSLSLNCRRGKLIMPSRELISLQTLRLHHIQSDFNLISDSISTMFPNIINLELHTTIPQPLRGLKHYKIESLEVTSSSKGPLEIIEFELPRLKSFIASVVDEPFRPLRPSRNQSPSVVCLGSNKIEKFQVNGFNPITGEEFDESTRRVKRVRRAELVTIGPSR